MASDPLDNTPSLTCFFTTGGSNPTLVGDQLKIYKDGVNILTATLDAGQLAGGYTANFGPLPRRRLCVRHQDLSARERRPQHPVPAVRDHHHHRRHADNYRAGVSSAVRAVERRVCADQHDRDLGGNARSHGYNYQWKRDGVNISGATSAPMRWSRPTTTPTSPVCRRHHRRRLIGAVTSNSLATGTGRRSTRSRQPVRAHPASAKC